MTIFSIGSKIPVLPSNNKYWIAKTAVVVKNSEVVFQKTYGVKNLKTKEPIDEYTLFNMGSTTKAIISIALGILVDQRKINWNDKVRDHLPSFELSDSYITEGARIKDLLKIYHPEVIKFFLISSHYRSALDFTNESLEQARAGLVRIYESIDEKIILKESDETDKGFVKDFELAMNDDLNTPKAISILFEIVKKINLEDDNSTKRCLVTTLKKLANIIGLLNEKPELFFQYGSGVDTQLIEEMILKRNLARKDKDFDKADEIRDELKSLGIILDDKADGTKWKKV